MFRPWSLHPAPCPDTCSTPNIPLKDWYHDLAARHPRLVKETVIGHTVLGQPIMAYKVTKNARRDHDGLRPAVIYDSTQHAREWIATEVERRLFAYFLQNADARGSVRRILQHPRAVVRAGRQPRRLRLHVHRPPATRLWRKNLRDNNGDGAITNIDGVDTNRNFPFKWNWDLEGASDDPADETFHGASARLGARGPGHARARGPRSGRPS